VVKKLDCQTDNWRFKGTEVLPKETYLFKYILAITIQGQGFELRIFSVKIPRPNNSSGSSKIILSTNTSWSSG
jgi:hypothetical protein